jgi:competence protein ComEC
MTMALPMAMWFHRIPLPALPVNLICLPMLMVLAPLGMLAFLLSLVSPWLAMLPMTAVAAMLHFAEWFAAKMAQLHISQIFFGSLRTPAPETPAIIIAVALMALAIFLAGRKQLRVQIMSLAALAGLVAASIWPVPMHRTPEMLEVSVIDVGQGDSILVVTPDGHTLLIDAGGPIGGPFARSASDASAAFDIGEEVVSPYLWQRQVRRLDVVAVTHPHSDHMGGMPAVMRNFRPRELWLGSALDAPEEHELLATAAELGIPVKHFSAGDKIQFGATPIRVLWPSADFELKDRSTERRGNNDSLVLELTDGASRALLEGDAEAPSETAMVASGLLQPVTLLKVAHHGSKTSSTDAFLNAVHPADAVISAGRENPFGHPRREVVNSLEVRGINVYRTDKMGAVTVLMDAVGNASIKTFVAK